MQAQANPEIKARCRNLAAARQMARRLATRDLGLDRQVDTYLVAASYEVLLGDS
jgi:hypothetical protein